LEQRHAAYSVVDNKGSIAEYFQISEGLGFHGFLRDRLGTITVIDAPGASSTYITAMNNGRAMTGVYFFPGDLSNTHGFVRAPDGSITTFDPPNAISTTSQSINFQGQIAGYFTDAGGVRHGFARDTDGTITQLYAPGATGTVPAAIGADGKIAGTAFSETSAAPFRLNEHGWKKRSWSAAISASRDTPRHRRAVLHR